MFNIFKKKQSNNVGYQTIKDTSYEDDISFAESMRISHEQWDKTNVSVPDPEPKPVKDQYDYDKNCFSKNYPRNYPMTEYALLEKGSIFAQDIKNIFGCYSKRIIFTDAAIPFQTKDVLDVSKNQDGTIFAWLQQVAGENMLLVSTGKTGRGILLDEDSTCMFAGQATIDSVFWNNVVSFNKVKNIGGMFKDCNSLKTVDLRPLNISNIENMQLTFGNCYNLKTVYLPDMSKASNLKTMDKAFKNCYAIRSVTFPNGLNTDNLKSLSGTFEDCHNLRGVDFGNSSSPNHILTTNMFLNTPLLESLSSNNQDIVHSFMNIPETDSLTKSLIFKNGLIRNVYPEGTLRYTKFSKEDEIKFRDVLNPVEDRVPEIFGDPVLDFNLEAIGELVNNGPVMSPQEIRERNKRNLQELLARIQEEQGVR